MKHVKWKDGRHACIAALQAVAWVTALSHVFEWLLGGVTVGQRGKLGSVFVSLRAALPAAGFWKNSTAQFLSTPDPPPPIFYPSSLGLFPAFSLFPFVH